MISETSQSPICSLIHSVRIKTICVTDCECVCTVTYMSARIPSVNANSKWWKLTKYINSSSVLMNNFEVLYFSIFIFLLLFTSIPVQFRDYIYLTTLVTSTLQFEIYNNNKTLKSQ